MAQQFANGRHWHACLEELAGPATPQLMNRGLYVCGLAILFQAWWTTLYSSGKKLPP